LGNQPRFGEVKLRSLVAIDPNILIYSADEFFAGSGDKIMYNIASP
jgi:hypothetical protein